jgi:hypothetical protein
MLAAGGRVRLAPRPVPGAHTGAMGSSGGPGPGRRRRLAVLGALAVVVVAVAAVLWTRRDDGSDTATEPPEPAEEGVLPLLGTTGEVPQRAALAVKVDATAHGRPQVGLLAADVVFEEVVEGGLTRLLAVYHSTDPETVGPVRSARSTDLFLLAELGRPLFAWSGANPTFAAAVEAADLIDVGVAAAPDAYERSDERRAPYNLFAAPAELRAAAEGEAGAATPPRALFTYPPEGEPLAGPGVEPAAGFTTTGAGGLATENTWEWDEDAGAWVRTQDGTPHVDGDGDRVQATNVLVRFTTYRDSGQRDVTGAVVPEAEPVGEGDAWLFSDGSVLRGRWQKPAEDAPTTFTTADGAPMALAPGTTWVEVLPPGTGDVVR